MWLTIIFFKLWNAYEINFHGFAYIVKSYIVARKQTFSLTKGRLVYYCSVQELLHFTVYTLSYASFTLFSFVYSLSLYMVCTALHKYNEALQAVV